MNETDRLALNAMLVRAAKHDKQELAKEVFGQGAYVDARDGKERTVLHWFAMHENTDMLLTNTSFGESWNLVARFNKRWDSGFFLNGSYTFQDVTDQNPGTSSVAFSNYTNTAFSDPNFAAQGIANYQRDHQFRDRPADVHP